MFPGKCSVKGTDSEKSRAGGPVLSHRHGYGQHVPVQQEQRSPVLNNRWSLWSRATSLKMRGENAQEVDSREHSVTVQSVQSKYLCKKT